MRAARDGTSEQRSTTIVTVVTVTGAVTAMAVAAATKTARSVRGGKREGMVVV
jgi:xanthine/CO dehydrogenase XdhC/CoxF family maturation factor